MALVQGTAGHASPTEDGVLTRFFIARVFDSPGIAEPDGEVGNELGARSTGPIATNRGELEDMTGRFAPG
jgi:hypothetical protein